MHSRLPDNSAIPQPFLSASAWSMPYVLMATWGLMQLLLQGSEVESLSLDIFMALIYSTVIAGSMLPTINRAIGKRLASGRNHFIIEDTLGCLLSVLALSIVLAAVLLVRNEYFRDPLHIATQLASVVLMANCWILSTVLSSSNKSKALFFSVALGAIVLAAAHFYQPKAGLTYHSLAWLSAIAVTLLIQAKALTTFLPRPSRIGLSLACGHPSSVELSLAGTCLCLSLWLGRPSAHSPMQLNDAMRLLEDSQSIAYLVLLPVAMLAWSPLERRFKAALIAFEQAAHGGGNLSTLDYQKNNLIFQSLSGMQRVHIALIAAVVVALTFDQIFTGSWSTLTMPSWLLPLCLLHVALQMVGLCAMRLLFFLQRDRELLIISLLQLLLIAFTARISNLEEGSLALSFGLVFSSGVTCILSVWYLRHRLERLDYLFFMGGQQVIPEAKHVEDKSAAANRFG